MGSIDGPRMQIGKSSYSLSSPEVRLPKEVILLLPRERELATIVYEQGACTANQVLRRLSVPLANASVRSMLNRLVAKRILGRIKSGRAFIYVPALTGSDSRALALRQFTDDYFDGSAGKAAAAMRDLLRSSR